MNKLDIDENIKRIMIDLPYLFGDVSVLDRAYAEGLNETSKAALENIKKIYELLCLYGFEKYISIDLGMLQSIEMCIRDRYHQMYFCQSHNPAY